MILLFLFGEGCSSKGVWRGFFSNSFLRLEEVFLKLKCKESSPLAEGRIVEKPQGSVEELEGGCKRV